MQVRDCGVAPIGPFRLSSIRWPGSPRRPYLHAAIPQVAQLKIMSVVPPALRSLEHDRTNSRRRMRCRSEDSEFRGEPHWELRFREPLSDTGRLSSGTWYRGNDCLFSDRNPIQRLHCSFGNDDLLLMQPNEQLTMSAARLTVDVNHREINEQRSYF
jgi:hypothetical protein